MSAPILALDLGKYKTGTCIVSRTQRFIDDVGAVIDGLLLVAPLAG